MSLYDLDFDEAERAELERPCLEPTPPTAVVPAPRLEPIGGIQRGHATTGTKRKRRAA